LELVPFPDGTWQRDWCSGAWSVCESTTFAIGPGIVAIYAAPRNAVILRDSNTADELAVVPVPKTDFHSVAQLCVADVTLSGVRATLLVAGATADNRGRLRIVTLLDDLTLQQRDINYVCAPFTGVCVVGGGPGHQLLICASATNSIVMLDFETGRREHSAGTGAFASGLMSAVHDMPGRVAVLDEDRSAITVYDVGSSHITHKCGSGDNVLRLPYGLACDGAGGIIASDYAPSRKGSLVMRTRLFEIADLACKHSPYAPHGFDVQMAFSCKSAILLVCASGYCVVNTNACT
jgi:hypothetical protein